MAHRTLNPTTAFYGDLRCGRRSDPKSKLKHDKYREAEVAYRQEFGAEIPNYWGSAFDAYKKMEAAGWKWSTRYGWRKKSA